MKVFAGGKYYLKVKKRVVSRHYKEGYSPKLIEVRFSNNIFKQVD